ncbi:MAG: hypothetical protein E6066_19420, partial [Oscillospiraceae bacterium]|nr:hypothetical protein [Oscillospiraceae bacterium]
LYQHFYHPTPLYRIPFPYTRKRPPIGGLFRQAAAALVYLPMPLLSSSKDLNAGIIIFSVQ